MRSEVVSSSVYPYPIFNRAEKSYDEREKGASPSVEAIYDIP